MKKEPMHEVKDSPLIGRELEFTNSKKKFVKGVVSDVWIYENKAAYRIRFAHGEYNDVALQQIHFLKQDR